MITIVGLGNPGERYDGTRHNIGYQVVATLAHRLGETTWSHQKHLLHSEVVNAHFRGEKIQLIKPGTYMNESGLVISALLEKHGLDLERLWVIHDDTEFPFGEVRVKHGGTSGGHNGIKSIDDEIGSEYWRIRIGVGRPESKDHDLSEYVLGKFTTEERELVSLVVDRVVSYLIKSMEDEIVATKLLCLADSPQENNSSNNAKEKDNQ